MYNKISGKMLILYVLTRKFLSHQKQNVMAQTGLSRRQFLGSVTLGTAHILFNNPLYAATGRFRSTDPLQLVDLGRSGIQTTLLGIGTGVKAKNRSSYMTRQGAVKSVSLLRDAYDRGIRFFDCADSYGTHGFMKEAMKGMERESLTVVSKMWTRSGGIPEPERPGADVVVDRFRKELGTDYIDLVQIHCMVDTDWTDSMRKQMDILDNLKAKGVIRAHGVSVHSLGAMKAALADPWVDVIHVRINPYGIAMDRPDPAEVVEVINGLHASGKGVIGMKLVGNGRLRDDSEKIDHTLQFVLGLGSVDAMIVGFETEEQIGNYIERIGTALGKIQ
jgi:aryl-alcohol dehydrogenase-like predicted oxidoreductase